MARDKENAEQLLMRVQQVCDAEKQIREKYQIGDKFRFLREQLLALLKEMNMIVSENNKESLPNDKELSSEREVIYVHLFNASGTSIEQWATMISSAVFYDYSINRPIYRDKNEIEAFIRSKSNKLQHAYLAIAIPSDSIISDLRATVSGYRLLKVKEGALHLDQLLYIFYNGQAYAYNVEQGFSLYSI
jgi:hypothetical protein